MAISADTALMNVATSMSRPLFCFGRSKLGPDQVPVLWTEVLPADNAFCFAIERSGKLGRTWSKPVNNVLKVPTGSAAGDGQCIALWHRERGKVGLEVHAAITSNDVLNVNIV